MASNPREPRRPATYDDILQAPEHKVAEIVDGELYVSPRPASRHAMTGSALTAALVTAFQQGRGGPGGWWIVSEPEMHFGEDVLVPDVAGWRRERMPDYPDVAYFTLPPDWVCEVLSPSAARLDRTRKLGVYARMGVSFVWLIDPLYKTLEVFELRDAVWTLRATFGGQETIRAVPFHAIDLGLAYLWGETPVPEAAERAAVETPRT